MRKILSLLIVCIMIIAPLSLSSSAARSKTDLPDWLITEILSDPNGDGRFGYTETYDAAEAFEMVNTSGRTLNLYDYVMTYNGSSTSLEEVVEITPFKAGDYRDGSTSQYKDASKQPVNPETAMIKPGEVIVFWALNVDSYKVEMTMDNFRDFWNIDPSVRVFAWDAQATANDGGHDKNFNLKNSGVGTYGVAHKDEVVEGEKTLDNLISYTRVDYNTEVVVKASNCSIIFTYDATAPDVRKTKFLDGVADPTFGKLTKEQIDSLPAHALTAYKETATTVATTTVATTTVATTTVATTKAPPVSPKTSDNSLIYIAVVMLSLTSIAVVSKKKTAR